MMRILTLVTLFAAAGLLAGCQNTSDSLGDLGSSLSGGVGRDTFGTNRRMDVYGGTTAPSMPTFGARGYGR